MTLSSVNTLLELAIVLALIFGVVAGYRDRNLAGWAVALLACAFLALLLMP